MSNEAVQMTTCAVLYVIGICFFITGAKFSSKQVFSMDMLGTFILITVVVPIGAFASLCGYIMFFSEDE